MNAADAKKLTRESDPAQLDFYKDKPLNETDYQYAKKIFIEEVTNSIKSYFDSPILNRGSLHAYFKFQWNNNTLKQYALENGFKVHCVNNGTSLMVTWDI